ncbi:MAG: glycosyltransferase family 39 protein, partial [Candidatus Eisenbacteria sp.]|nr:glycosyltransferase family 39 protein [Candidatus Eisenbacteria bacterium]
MRNSARPQSSRSRQPAGRRAGSRTAAATWACAAPAAWAALIFLVGLYIHLTYYPIGNVGVETDFYGGMAPAAQKLSAGDFSVTDYPYRGPFYSVVLVLVNLLVRDWYHSGVLLNLLCAAGSILLISRLHGRLYNRSVALATAVFTSLLYPFFIDAHKATSDHLFLFLALLSISLVIRDRAVAWRLFAGGVVCALAFLTRYNGVLLAFGAGIALLVVNPDRASWKRRLVWCGVFLLGFLIVSAPWFAKSLVETGQLLWTKNIKNITMAFYGASAGGDDPAKEFESLGDLIASDRGYFVSRLGRNLVDHLGNDLRYLIDRAGSILVLLGVVRLLLRAPTRRQWALYSFAGVYFTGMGLVFYLPRFFVFLAVTYYALAFCVLFGSGGGRETALGLRARQLWRARAARGIRRSITAIQGVPRFRVVCICIVLVLLGGMKLRATIHLEQAY